MRPSGNFQLFYIQFTIFIVAKAIDKQKQNNGGSLMLDDLKMIHERDAQDSLGVAAKQWQQLKHVYDTDFKSDGRIDNVVVGGMGGSALAAEIINSWPGLEKPFQIAKNYEIPEYTNE